MTYDWRDSYRGRALSPDEAHIEDLERRLSAAESALATIRTMTEMAKARGWVHAESLMQILDETVALAVAEEGADYPEPRET